MTEQINLDAFRDNDADVLIERVESKIKPVFANFDSHQRRAIYRYQFPRKPQKLPPSMKSRIINLYDPMADRTKRFPDGLRWCANIYVGCEHNCGYCYVNGYSPENVGIDFHPKKDFERNLLKDIKDLKTLEVPATALHISNSTDPLQAKLENKHQHTLLMVKQATKNRDLFTSIVILTKNPMILTTEPYLSIITNPWMKPFTVQVSCAFWQDNVRKFYEPTAPPVKERLEAMKKLVAAGVDVELRIDPLFPTTRVEKEIRKHNPLPDYGIPEAQTKNDIESLVKFSADAGASSIIAKPLKVPVSNKAQHCKGWFKTIYSDANEGQGRSVKGGSWRLPERYQKALMSSIHETCKTNGIKFKHCMHDVLTRK